MTQGEDRADVAQREQAAAKAIRLKISGLTWAQVGAQLHAEYGMYRRASSAFNLVNWALKVAREEVNQSLEELRQVEDIRDDDLRRRLYSIMVSPHPLIQNGKIVKDDDGNPIQDHAPVLACIDRLNRVGDRYARRWGLEAPKDLNIALERRTDLEGSIVAEAILAGIDSAGLDPSVRMRALEAAQARLNTIEGEVVREGPGELD